MLSPDWCWLWKALYFINHLIRNHFAFMLIYEIILLFKTQPPCIYLLNKGQFVWKREIMAFVKREFKPIVQHRSPCCFKQLFQILAKWKGQVYINIKEHRGSHYPLLYSVSEVKVCLKNISLQSISLLTNVTLNGHFTAD